MREDRRQLVEKVRSAVADQTSEHDILQAAVTLIDEFSSDYDWTGFYMVRGDALEVGPYVGPETPHKRIEFNQGLCGAAASQQKTIVVDDVNADPRFLACSVTTRSEIVVPLMDGDTCIGEIDIDSNTPGFFTDDDRAMLEAVAGVVVKRLREIR